MQLVLRTARNCATWMPPRASCFEGGVRRPQGGRRAADAPLPGGPDGIDAVDRPPFACGIDDVYSVCAPLVDPTIELLGRILHDPARDGRDVAWSEVAGIYVVGGAGGFPLVSRMLRTTFGDKRVKRSPHPFAATAIGLAVFLDKEAGFELSERFSRHFGVFREAEAGAGVVFDPIVRKDVVTSRRRAHPAGRPADVPGGAQHRALPLRGVQPPRQRPPRRRRDALRSGALPVRPGPATTATTSGASRSAGGRTGRTSRSATSSRPAARWR